MLPHWYKASDLSLKDRAVSMMCKTVHGAIEYLIRGAGFYRRGYQNALNLLVRHETLNFHNLSSKFDGLRILFLSDLHIGGMKELPDILIEKLSGLEADICLLGGDYRFNFLHPTRPFLAELRRIVKKIQVPLGIYGVLGNHDDLDIVPTIEDIGMRILLNDSVSKRSGEDVINLVGVDEPFYFKRHDMKKAFNAIPRDKFTICLTHSPDLYHEAEAHGAHLYLCGHTHHGQVRIPVVGPLVTLTTAPRKFATGIWQYKNMQGLTGPGIGAAQPPIRFRCPPAVIVLTLRRKL